MGRTVGQYTSLLGYRVSASTEDIRRNIEGIDQLEAFLKDQPDSPVTITVENGAKTSIDTTVEELERFFENENRTSSIAAALPVSEPLPASDHLPETHSTSRDS